MSTSFYSTRNKAGRWPLDEVIMHGLAPDGGLFMPERIVPFPSAYFNTISKKTFQEISLDVASQLLGDAVSNKVLKEIVEKAVSFDAPLVEVEKGVYSLELFHGPTLAFKDFGARFLAGLMAHVAAGRDQEIVVLVATSGDTGSAVAHGFFNVPGIRVIILYPSGKVSPLQERQLTTLGGNITAWEVSGTFDDCQRLVKEMFLDQAIRKKFVLTSANSINIGRLLPQSFYYFHAWAQLPPSGKPVVFSVPSGNFGNLTSGIIAKRLGLPVSRFVASTNVNDVVPDYLSTGRFQSRPSVQTISNAMDVGNPSNFARLLDLYGPDHRSMTEDISGFSFSDGETKAVIDRVFRMAGYLLDPHGAVSYLGLTRFLAERATDAIGIFLETAHPGKFSEVVEGATGREVVLPERLAHLKDREKNSVLVSSSLDDARQRLLES